MENNELTEVAIFCRYHSIDTHFVFSLRDSGLLELEEINQTAYLYNAQLADLEKLLRLHYDLHINVEGLEAITHLLNRVHTLQQENQLLKRRLTVLERH